MNNRFRDNFLSGAASKKVIFDIPSKPNSERRGSLNKCKCVSDMNQNDMSICSCFYEEIQCSNAPMRSVFSTACSFFCVIDCLLREGLFTIGNRTASTKLELL